MKETSPESIYTHCEGHKLNLVMVKTCECIVPATSLFMLEQETAVFLSESHKRLDIWKEITSATLVGGAKLKILVKKLDGTRWWSKGKGVEQIFGNDSVLSILIFVLETIFKDTSFKPMVRATASSLLKKWTKLETMIVGVTFQQIFHRVSPISKYLQSKKLDFIQVHRMTYKLIKSIEDLNFSTIMKKVRCLVASSNVTLESCES